MVNLWILRNLCPFGKRWPRYNLPVYIHPWRSDKIAEYPAEESTKYGIASIFGWPYETTAAMTRFVFSGILEKYPNLKIVTHHCGGMIPYLSAKDSPALWPGLDESQWKLPQSLEQSPAGIL